MVRRVQMMLMLVLMAMTSRSHGLALGDRGDEDRGRGHEGGGASHSLDEGAQQMLIDGATDLREAELREALLREFEAIQQQERNTAYLALLLDRLRSLPPLEVAPVAPRLETPQAPPPQEADLLPVAARLQQHYLRPNPEEKKSSNYISYCHFKICNMGKRKWN